MTLAFMHINDPSVYISSEQEVLFIIRATDALVKNNHKPASFCSDDFSTRLKAFFVKARAGTQRNAKCDFQALPFFETKIQQP